MTEHTNEKEFLNSSYTLQRAPHLLEWYVCYTCYRLYASSCYILVIWRNMLFIDLYPKMLKNLGVTSTISFDTSNISVKLVLSMTPML